MLYRVTVGATEFYEIEAESEDEAYDIAYGEWKNLYGLFPDFAEVEEIDGDE